jgi:type II secretory pathway pseudopilin PulG
MRAAAGHGYSMLELVFVLAVIATLTGVAVPNLTAALDEHRTAAAARYLAARIQRTRIEAVKRSANTAIQFVQAGAGYTYSVYVDGNGDGVRTQDIADGIDERLGVVEGLGDNFPGVDIGVIPALPAIETGGPPPGTTPIRLGVGNLLSYSPTGSSSSGTVYLHGQKGTQYAIRILGDTGRARILEFDRRRRKWNPA